METSEQAGLRAVTSRGFAFNGTRFCYNQRYSVYMRVTISVHGRQICFGCVVNVVLTDCVVAEMVILVSAVMIQPRQKNRCVLPWSRTKFISPDLSEKCFSVEK